VQKAHSAFSDGTICAGRSEARVALVRGESRAYVPDLRGEKEYVMSVSAEADVVARMLDEGRLTHVDQDGHTLELFGSCPDDGSRAPVHRVNRNGRRIVEVMLRCPSCGHDFTAAPESMHLR
jgi:hypothetical protein